MSFDPFFNNVSLLLHFEGADGSTAFLDSSDNAVTVTANGDVHLDDSQKKFGSTSGYFDGTGDYLTCTLPVNFARDFTVEGFYYPQAGQDGGAMLETRTSDSNTSGFIIYRRSGDSNRLTFGYWNGSSFITAASVASMTAGEWHYYCVKRVGNTVAVYLNGVAGGTCNVTANFTNTAVRLGTSWSGGEPTKGWFDELRITANVARPPSTAPAVAFPNETGADIDPYFDAVALLLHFEGADGSTVITDSSDNAVTVTANSDAQLDTALSKFGGASLLVNGTYDAISFPGLFNAGAGDWTAEWFYRSAAAPEAFGRMFQTRDGDVIAGIGLNQENANQVKLYADAAASGGWDYTSPAVTFSPLTWQHFALVRKSGTLSLYVDGIAYASTTVAPANDAAQTWIMGGQTIGPSRSLKGNFDEVRFTQDFARYDSIFTPPLAPFPDGGGSGGGPTIDTQPADTTVLQGETATFTVVATGTGTLLYQWFENGAFMLGENADTLNVTATLLRDGNTYTVRVTDDSDSVTSDPAELTVTPASSIAPVLQGPADVTVQEGQQAVFNVTAYGVGPFTYQWRVGGGAVVPGATSRVLTVPGLPQYDGAYYQVTVTDASGLVTASEYAQLTVTPEPVRGRGTADVDYPCALPGPLVAGNAYRSKSRVRRNDLASGPPIYRLEDDDGYDLFNVAWSFSAGEVQVFRNWFRCDIASGSRLFNIWLMVDGAATRGGRQTVLHSCYFDGVPEYTQRGRRWSVSATLLAIREEAVDCCANLPDLYNGFCGELKRAINAFTDIWPATPPVPTVDLPIECQPYSCSAYEVYAASVGRTFLPAYSPSAAPWAYPFVGDSPVRYRVGAPAPGDAVSDWASGIDPVVPLAWQQVDTAPTFCDGAVLQCIGLGYSGGQSPRGVYPATAQWGSIGLNAIVTGAAGTSRMAGVVLRASDGFTATVNGIGGYQFNPRVNISLSATDLGGGDWEISATIEVFGDDEAPIPPVSTVLGVVGDEWVSFSAYVDMTQPYPSGAGAGIAVDFAAVIRVAGQTLSLSDTITFASGSSTLSYVTARAPGNQSSYFRECSISILAMNLIDTFENLDIDGADLAFQRNRPDYTPPPSCPAVP